jgi:hypothetical protein
MDQISCADHLYRGHAVQKEMDRVADAKIPSPLRKNGAKAPQLLE